MADIPIFSSENETAPFLARGRAACRFRFWKRCLFACGSSRHRVTESVSEDPMTE